MDLLLNHTCCFNQTHKRLTVKNVFKVPAGRQVGRKIFHSRPCFIQIHCSGFNQLQFTGGAHENI
jgi:hypothetical protein